MSWLLNHLEEELGKLYAEAKVSLHSLEHEVEAALGRWATSSKVLRVAFKFAREYRPILVTPKATIVTRYDDVVEVLTRDGDFSVVPTYAAKMHATSGDFFLGMDASPQHDREAGIVRKAISRTDLETIARIVSRECEARIAAAAAKTPGRLDVVDVLTRAVPAQVVAEFFGVPGPDAPTLKRWMRAIFWEIFLNPTNDSEVTAAASVASAELKSYLDQLIAERKAEIASGAPVGDDFLTRLLRMQADPETRLEDEAIRRNVGGVIVGAVDTISKSVAQSLNVLLDQPAWLERAHAAAVSGNDKLVYAIAFDALRFDPQNPILIRTALREVTIARGTDRETVIPAGTTVVAATLSAMFDPERFPSPDEIRTDRPDGNYLFFGDGLHVCFGQYVSRVEIPLILKHLYALPHLRRAAGDEGEIAYEGPFPDHLFVEYGAEAEGH
jgi:cytochrome P450